MGEYTPTTGMAASRYAAGRRSLEPADTQRVAPSELDNEFYRMLDEVERAAAEKAWDECADEISMQGTVQLPENPYREGKR